ncbi:YihY/virulence factor BrkB family protein [Chitinimonas arctica]|nr:YihY/virulence factor BrkB family protein [Chitinimonas arctica]
MTPIDLALAYWEKIPRSIRSPLQLCWQAASRWLEAGGPQWGATIAFYAMFAMAPLLVLAITIASIFFGEEAARGQIVQQITGVVGHKAAQGVEAMIASAWHTDSNMLAGGIGLLTLLLGASGVFVELRRAFNAIFQVGRPLPAASDMPTAINAYLRARLIAFSLVLSTGLLVIMSLLLSSVLAALTTYLSRHWPRLADILSFSDLLISTLLITLSFAALVRWLPDERPPGRVVWAAALSSALLFALGKHLIGLYLGRTGVASSFGAAGSFVVIMSWVYYTTQILLLGAAFGMALRDVDGGEASERLPKATVPDG